MNVGGLYPKTQLRSLNSYRRGEIIISPKEKALTICQIAQGKKAEKIVLMDMKASGFCDYFVIASAESTRRVKAICEAIVEGLHKKGIRVSHSEGETEALWALLDFGDVVVHIFYHETREFYNLERLWHEAPKETIPSTWQDSVLKKKLLTL